MSIKIYLSPAAHAIDNPCSFDPTHCGENIHCNLYMDELEPILKACGFDVKRNPKSRTGDQLHLAIEEANDWDANLYYVAHTNGGGGAYSKLMVYNRGTGYTYAEKIKAQEQAIYTNPINISVEPQWAEVSQTKMPCVYHEVVFHDNIDEITYFHHHFRDFAVCVAKGICDCFGVTFVNPYDEIVYTVVSGDTLSGIAAKYGTTYQRLAEYNGIADPSKIYPGQQIKIPGAVSNTPAPAETAPTTDVPASKPAGWDQHGPNPTLVWDYQYDSAVADLQRILIEKGAALAVDGKAGNNTYNAVKKYTVKKGDSGPLVKWVQQRLTSVGCPCGTIDGIAGDKTISAIQSFQAYYALGQGYLGGTDWYYLIR